MTDINVDFSSTDPQIATMLGTIEKWSKWEPERHEMEAHLYLALARSAWREADRIRSSKAYVMRRAEIRAGDE